MLILWPEKINKNQIITMIKKGLLIATMAMVCGLTAQAIDEYQFHRGTAVLKGRILNRPAGEWTSVSIKAYNIFIDTDRIVSIPVKDDGTFEAAITLPHSQGVHMVDIGHVFLAVGDTLELTKDASKMDMEGVTFGGNGVSATINRLWPQVKKHYFGNGVVSGNNVETEQIAAWKKELVRLTDVVIADVKADKLPVPAGTGSYEKEVLGASALSVPLMEVMRLNFINMMEGKKTESYDFLADREQWLLDNPAMVFMVDDPDIFFGLATLCMMVDVSYGVNNYRIYPELNEPQAITTYKQNFMLPRDYDKGLHRQMLALRGDTLLSIADYFRLSTEAAKKRFGLKKIGFTMQVALSRNVFDEIRMNDETNTDHMAARFAAVVPYMKHPATAMQVVELYRNYVKENEGGIDRNVSTSPEGDAIFERIIAPYKGNDLYVDFWSWGCGPCRKKMMDEREKVEMLKDDPVRFLYIADEKDTNREQAERWMQENNIKGEHIFVTHEEWKFLSAKFQFAATPFGTAVDKKGKLTTQKVLDKKYD